MTHASSLQSTSAAPCNAGPIGPHLLWCDLLKQVGWDMEDRIDAVLQVLTEAAVQGRVRSAAVCELRRSLEKARHIGVRSQQIASIAERGVRVSNERIKLDELIQEALQAWAGRIRAGGHSVLRMLSATEVCADRKLLSALIDGLMAWSLEHAVQRLELHLEPGTAAGEAELVCGFQHRHDRARRSRFSGPAAWGADWHLLRQAADALAWRMHSADDGAATWVRFSFPCVDLRASPGIEVVELEAGAACGRRNGASDGRVLVVTSCAVAQASIADTVEHLGLDVVFSEAEVARVVPHLAPMPSAIVMDQRTPQVLLTYLKQVCASTGCALVQISADDDEVEIGAPSGKPFSRIGLGSIGAALPVALLLALPRPVERHDASPASPSPRTARRPVPV